MELWAQADEISKISNPWSIIGIGTIVNVLLTLLLTKGMDAWQKRREQLLKEKISVLEQERKSKEVVVLQDGQEQRQIEEGLRLYIDKQEARFNEVDIRYNKLLDNYQHCIEDHSKEKTAREFFELRLSQVEASLAKLNPNNLSSGNRGSSPP